MISRRSVFIISSIPCFIDSFVFPINFVFPALRIVFNSVSFLSMKQGIFSYALVQGLSGRADVDQNSIITVTELFDYLYKQVRKHTFKFQNPIITGSYDENMPVGIVHE